MIFVNVAVVFLAALALRTLFHAQAETAALLGFAEPSLATRLILCALLQPLCIFLHECGHLAAGLALDQKCRRFLIGPFQWAMEGDRPKVRLVIPKRAGLVDLVPATFTYFRHQRMLIAAAGPLASIVAGLFLTALARRAPNGEGFWILSFAALCSMAAAVELIPMRWGSAHSDGLILLEAIRGGPVFDRTVRNFLTLSAHSTPLRLRDWPEDLIARLTATTGDAVTHRYHLYLAYLFHQDRNEAEAAGAELDKLLGTWNPQNPPEYALEAAYVFGFQRRDAAQAAEWLGRAAQTADAYVRLRAEAAVEWAQGNAARARELAEQGLEACRQAPDCGALRYEVEMLWELHQESALEPAAETAA